MSAEIDPRACVTGYLADTAVTDPALLPSNQWKTFTGA